MCSNILKSPSLYNASRSTVFPSKTNIPQTLKLWSTYEEKMQHLFILLSTIFSCSIKLSWKSIFLATNLKKSHCVCGHFYGPFISWYTARLIQFPRCSEQRNNEHRWESSLVVGHRVHWIIVWEWYLWAIWCFQSVGNSPYWYPR